MYYLVCLLNIQTDLGSMEWCDWKTTSDASVLNSNSRQLCCTWSFSVSACGHFGQNSRRFVIRKFILHWICIFFKKRKRISTWFSGESCINVVIILIWNTWPLPYNRMSLVKLSLFVTVSADFCTISVTILTYFIPSFSLSTLPHTVYFNNWIFLIVYSFNDNIYLFYPWG